MRGIETLQTLQYDVTDGCIILLFYCNSVMIEEIREIKKVSETISG